VLGKSRNQTACLRPGLASKFWRPCARRDVGPGLRETVCSASDSSRGKVLPIPAGVASGIDLVLLQVLKKMRGLASVRSSGDSPSAGATAAHELRRRSLRVVSRLVFHRTPYECATSRNPRRNPRENRSLHGGRPRPPVM